jgi:ceramide glucosyltransferase
MFAHELRWARTVRQIDPGGYAGSIVTYPLPMALLAGLLLARSAPGAALTLICVILGVRIASKFAMKPVTGARAGHWWMIPARDVLSVCVFFASFAVDTVHWRGVEFRVERDGALSHPKG